MKLPADVFTTLTAPSAYKVKRLLRSSEFAQFAAERGEQVDEARLRKLEQLGIFLPMLRIRRDDDLRKIEMVGANQYRDLGALDDGEDWSGETRTELIEFGFEPHIVTSWREHGCIWSPLDGPSEHDPEIDAAAERHEAYYSEFQIWDLMWVLSSLTLSIFADNALDAAGTPNGNYDNLTNRIVEIADQAREQNKIQRWRAAYGLFAQVISDRFYAQTQTDGRLITISEDICFHGWKWEDYTRSWNPDQTVATFQIESDSSRNIESQLIAEQSMTNPIDAWSGLTRFIAMDQRKRLKGKALLAESLGEMADMHRRFHLLAFGETLPDPYKRGFMRGTAAPVPVRDDPYRALEWVTNRFHLNPKPKLVLIVEGQTEEAIIPDIFERWFGATAALYGIQIRNMHGVGNATGNKRDGMSALWRLVDFLHAQQTITLVLLDREGLAAKNVGKGLLNALSIHFTDRRVTRREYVKLWNRCFELDNFSNTEIARAMTALSGIKFHVADLAPCRPSSTSKVKPVSLNTVYLKQTGRELNKVALSRCLVETMFDPATKRQPKSRPIIRFLQLAASRAALNHQPTTPEIWEENQRSGFLGALRPGAASRRKWPQPKEKPV
jgi:hypothetical protein